MNGVQPLFRVPSGVLFAEKANAKRNIPPAGKKGISFTGNLPAHNCNWISAEKKITEEEVIWFYSKQGKSSAFSKRKSKAQIINPYKQDFKRGAEITPRNFYFIELDQVIPPDFEGRILNIKTANAIKPDAKAPWKGNDLIGRIESRFLFRTALSKSILPFTI